MTQQVQARLNYKSHSLKGLSLTLYKRFSQSGSLLERLTIPGILAMLGVGGHMSRSYNKIVIGVI